MVRFVVVYLSPAKMSKKSFKRILLIIGVSILIIIVVKNLGDYFGPKFAPENAENIDPTHMVKDVEGNVYRTVTIGSQVWMAENLRTNTYNDGEPIKQFQYTFYSSTNKGGYCWCENDTRYKLKFGALYNWYAVDTKKLCPVGWHVPTDDEFKTLVNFLGGRSVAGSKMKETGITHWSRPNKDATNSSGFSALPSHYSPSNVPFVGWGGSGAQFWSSTQSTSENAWDIELRSFDGAVARYNYSKNWGYSIRCLKD